MRYRAGHKGFRATPYGSGTKEGEVLANASRRLAAHPLLWNPPPARYVILSRTYSLAHGENTKFFLFKEQKLFV